MRNTLRQYRAIEEALAQGYPVGKQHTQTIASKHINLRTRMKRLVRRTIGFSKTTTMHDLVIGLFINRYAFGVLI
jgi:insertion element IS1 protein InsB